MRIIQVPEEEHESTGAYPTFSLLECVGKNAGARRARGKFLLLTNPDNIMAPVFVETLSQYPLQETIMYSSFRDSVSAHVPVGRRASARSMLRFVAANQHFEHFPVYKNRHDFNHARCLGSQQEHDDVPVHATGYGSIHDSAAGDFLIVSREMMHSSRGYLEVPSNELMDRTLLYVGATRGYGQLIFGGDCVLFDQPHPRRENTLQSTQLVDYEAYVDIVREMFVAGLDANVRESFRPETRREGLHVRDVKREDEHGVPYSRFNTPDWGFARASLNDTTYRAVCGGTGTYGGVVGGREGVGGSGGGGQEVAVEACSGSECKGTERGLHVKVFEPKEGGVVTFTCPQQGEERWGVGKGRQDCEHPGSMAVMWRAECRRESLECCETVTVRVEVNGEVVGMEERRLCGGYEGAIVFRGICGAIQEGAFVNKVRYRVPEYALNSLIQPPHLSRGGSQSLVSERCKAWAGLSALQARQEQLTSRQSVCTRGAWLSFRGYLCHALRLLLRLFLAQSYLFLVQS